MTNMGPHSSDSCVLFLRLEASVCQTDRENNRFVYKATENCENYLSQFPGDQGGVLFCQNSRLFNLTIIEDQEKQQIIAFEKLQQYVLKLIDNNFPINICRSAKLIVAAPTQSQHVLMSLLRGGFCTVDQQSHSILILHHSAIVFHQLI